MIGTILNGIKMKHTKDTIDACRELMLKYDNLWVNNNSMNCFEAIKEAYLMGMRDIENRQFNIKCEISIPMPNFPNFGGTTNMEVVRVEIEDDDSITVVTNEWPKR